MNAMAKANKNTTEGGIDDDELVIRVYISLQWKKKIVWKHDGS
jgi:hypothetical protein